MKIKIGRLQDSVMLAFIDYQSGFRSEVWLNEAQRLELVERLQRLEPEQAAPVTVVAQETHLPMEGGT